MKNNDDKSVTLPFGFEELPEGWFTKAQVTRLYELALTTPGPILEIGPWIGRSTCVICHALRQRTDLVEYHTVDYGFASEEEWKQRFGSELRSKPNASRYLPHINQPGGSITSLRRNLEERGLENFVHVHRGDFHEVAPPGPYALIFCDATHNRREIDANVPKLLTMLKPGGILACDDINDELFDYLTNRFQFSNSQRDAYLFSGVVA